MLHLQLFLAAVRLEFLTIDVLSLLPKTTKSSQHVMINMHRYSKLTVAVLTARTLTIVEMSIFFDLWVISHGIPSYPQDANGTQSSNIFLASYVPSSVQNT